MLTTSPSAIADASSFPLGRSVWCGSTMIHAICDTCSHEDFPLSEGEVELDECLIECWKHGSMFSLDTGAPVCFPATQPVAVYEVVVHDGKVSVRVP